MESVCLSSWSGGVKPVGDSARPLHPGHVTRDMGIIGIDTIFPHHCHHESMSPILVADAVYIIASFHCYRTIAAAATVAAVAVATPPPPPPPSPGPPAAARKLPPKTMHPAALSFVHTVRAGLLQPRLRLRLSTHDLPHDLRLLPGLEAQPCVGFAVADAFPSTLFFTSG